MKEKSSNGQPRVLMHPQWQLMKARRGCEMVVVAGSDIA